MYHISCRCILLVSLICCQVGEAYNVLSDQTKRQRYDSGQDLEDMGMGQFLV